MDLEIIKKALLQLGSGKIRFIILFGSTVQGLDTPLSDLDLAVYYQGDEQERFDFRKKASGHLPDKVDLHVFQDLPLAVQKEALEGKVLYYDNFDFIFTEFMRVIKDYNFFEKYYLSYLAELRKEVEV